MPFLRIVRDKRGYEYFTLIHQSSGRRGKVRQQVLYWFRTPPNIKVGRLPLDDEVMRALEARNPDIQFDWEALRDTPPPLPSAEPWRERRRAERAVRQLQDQDETDLPTIDPELVVAVVAIEAIQSPESELPPPPLSAAPTVEVGEPANGSLPAVAARRRHRRRGRRGRPDAAAAVAGSALGSTDGAAPLPSVPALPGSSDPEE